MEALIYLIPAALFLGMLGLGAFFWALKNGQFDDLDGAAMRILLDDPVGKRPPPEAGASTAAKPKGKRRPLP